jgi:putative GTP pyrophosphokinase
MTELREEYRSRYDKVLKPLAKAVEDQLHEYFSGEPRIDRITARAKAIDSFFTKAATLDGGKPKYDEPLRQIQDQVGARVVVYYVSDVERAAAIVEKYYRQIEARTLVPESEWEFGYFGKHYVLLVPSELSRRYADKDRVPEFFELQLKTLFQHAWSEAEHDLGYKPGAFPVGPDAKRRLAYTSAQAWGADRTFEELFRELRGAS